MKKGRPSDYNEVITSKICSLLADGISLKRICEQEDMPNKDTVYQWLIKHKEFADNYARAKDDSSDALADDIQNISDDVLSGIYEPQAARVAIDAKKWIASKLKPKKYGDKIDMTTNGKDLPTPILSGMSRTDINNGIDEPLQ